MKFPGFDPNGNAATNMAWVFKKDYLANSIDETQTNENSFFVYPNPANNIISWEYNEAIIQVTLINSIGQRVASIPKPANKMDVSTMKNGVYFLQFYSGNGIIKTSKAIFQH